MTRYTLYLLQPDGSHRVHCTGDGAAPDPGRPERPWALLTDLRKLYGDEWSLVVAWAGGWRVEIDDPEQGTVDVGYIDYGPAPEPAHPDQVGLFG